MKKLAWWFAPVLCLLLMRCTKEPTDNLTASESRIYITNYDTSAVFSEYSTFRIADSVAVIVNGQFRGRDLTQNDANFISTIATALQQRGYERVQNATADLGVTLNVITNTQTQLVRYTDYGGFYGGYWDPYYWGYPDYSYYFPTYYGTYETGETALEINIIDLKNAGGNNNQLRVIWSGMIRGAGIFNDANVGSQIAALFEQSPYLKK